MSAQGPFSSGPFSGGHPFSTGFLQAWVDQAGAFQDMFTKLANRSGTAVPPSMPPPLLAPWKNFMDGLGVNGFDPAQMFSGAPALGVTREYQESAARLLELSKQ